MKSSKLRVLLVPDTRHWILGRIAESLVCANEWVEGTIVSTAVLAELMALDSEAVGPFDLVHFVDPRAGGLIHHFKGRIPIVTTLHHFDTKQHLDSIRQGDATCAPASMWRDWLLENGWTTERVELVPNGVDSTAFCPLSVAQAAAMRSQLGIASDAVVIGFVGKPAPDTGDRKGSDVFVDAICRLGRERDGVVALILGPGWTSVRQTIEASGVKCVSVPFVREHVELNNYYAVMDLYWITARIEGGPCTLLEAMSAGRCAVTTPVGMVPDLVRDGENAAVIPIADPSALVARSVELLDNDRLRESIGAAARVTILSRYDWMQTARGVHELYRKATRHWQLHHKQPHAFLALPDARSEGAAHIEWSQPRHPGIAPRWRSWVQVHEDLLWMRRLAQLGDMKGAQKMSRSLLMRRPLDLAVLRAARDVLPNSAIGRALGALSNLRLQRQR